MIIHAPEKRKDHYVSQVTTGRKHQQPFTVRVSDARVVGIHELANDAGYLVKLWIAPDNPALDAITDVDREVIDTSIEHNQEWFANSLSRDKINEYFRPCVNQQVCSVIVSTVKVPRSLVVCGTTVDDFSCVQSAPAVKRLTCDCTLEIQGVYFYPKKFGVRWIVRTLELYDGNVVPSATASADAPSGWDREEIEDFWRTEVQEAHELIGSDITALYAKIDALAALKRDLTDSLKAARRLPECDSTWDEQLESLKGKIFKYKTGRL